MAKKLHAVKEGRIIKMYNIVNRRVIEALSRLMIYRINETAKMGLGVKKIT